MDSGTKAVQRVVETGPKVFGLRAIRDGLAPTDRVIIEGVSQLQPGATVTPKQTQIKPVNDDAGPEEPAVTVPQSASATFSGQAR